MSLHAWLCLAEAEASRGTSVKQTYVALTLVSFGGCGTQAKAECLVGDVFISAACIAYLGPFTGAFRADLIRTWIAKCQEGGLPVSKDVSLRSTLATPLEVRLIYMY
jgi:hypothetical protein